MIKFFSIVGLFVFGILGLASIAAISESPHRIVAFLVTAIFWLLFAVCFRALWKPYKQKKQSTIEITSVQIDSKNYNKVNTSSQENLVVKTSNESDPVAHTLTSKQSAKMTYKERRAFQRAGGTILLSAWQKIALWIIGILIVALVAQCSKSDKTLSPEEAAKKDRQSLISSVKYTCRHFIEKSLNDPDSIVYGRDPSDTIVVEKKSGLWIVQQNLRARNGFNALIKTSITCTISYDGKNFYLISLKSNH